MADVSPYFPAARECPTFVDDSEWVPLVDGQAYFTELDDHLRRAGAGDTVLIAGLEVDPDLDLGGRSPGDPGYAALGERLAVLASRGVDVRLLIAGRVFAANISWSGLGPFRANALRAETMREMTVGGSRPLDGRVLLDFSGGLLGSNHTKAVTTHIGGELTAFVGGIDLVTDRYEDGAHDRLRNEGERWGWHDMVVRLRGPAARAVWETFATRWRETTTLPDEHYLRSLRDRRLLNPLTQLAPLPPAPETAPIENPGVAVRVLRSLYHRKVDSRLPFRRLEWEHQPRSGYQEVFTTLITAIGAARRYVYIEDQYLGEEPGGEEPFELYPYLHAAARRGVKIVLVGSGTRDPEDAGLRVRPINRELNDDLQDKLVAPLPPDLRANVAVYRVEHCTVHAKLTLVDDVFANIGSANMFSRSMSGVDSELAAAVTTSTSLVRDLRVAVWGEHLRAQLTPDVRTALADLDLALGIWRSTWLPDGVPATTWLTAGRPSGFAPRERVLTLVGPT